MEVEELTTVLFVESVVVNDEDVDEDEVEVEELTTELFVE